MAAIGRIVFFGRSSTTSCTNNCFREIAPKSHQLADEIVPTGFHWFVLIGRKSLPGFGLRTNLFIRHAIVQTRLYRVKWPHRGRSVEITAKLYLKSESTNTQVEAKLPAMLIELIRRGNPATDVSAIFSGHCGSDRISRTEKYLYLLYLLGAINLRRPEKKHPRRRFKVTVLIRQEAR